MKCSLDEVKRLKPEELKRIIEMDKKGEYVLVDVRQPEEYEDGHIPGARLIPLGELEKRQNELERDRKIVTYCRSGHRSMGAATLLCGLGFKDVYTMEGGILNWNHETLTGLAEERPDLITGKEEVGGIFMAALKMENGSNIFYLKAVEEVKSEKTVATFHKLAQIEEIHMKKIYNQYIKLLGKERLPSLDTLRQKLNSDYMEGGIKINKALFELEKFKFRDEMESLEIALEKEYLSYDFYKRMAGLMNDSDSRALLHELAGEERNHINNLLSGIRKMVGRS